MGKKGKRVFWHHNCLAAEVRGRGLDGAFKCNSKFRARTAGRVLFLRTASTSVILSFTQKMIPYRNVMEVRFPFMFIKGQHISSLSEIANVCLFTCIHMMNF